MGQCVIKHFATEFDLVREVLFLFNGSTSTIFDLQDGIFVYKHKYSLKHLSDGALVSLMSKFAIMANDMHSVVDYTNCGDSDNITLVAFQAAVFDIVVESKTKMLDLEKKLRIRNRENPDLFIRIDGNDVEQDFSDSLDTVSLIWLDQKLDRLLLPLKTAHKSIKALTRFKQVLPGVNSCFLLTYLYENVCKEQEMDREIELQTYLEIFTKSLIPVMRMIGSTFSSRSGAWQSYKEFFLQINPDCHKTENLDDKQLDWSTCCFSIDDNCPVFLKPFLDKFLRAFRSCLMIDTWVTFY
jgi:Gamma tubulin complex component N-terminal